MSSLVANVIRSGRLESQHHGHVAVVDARGELLASVGDPGLATYIRSAAKPFQIMPMITDRVDAHFGFTDRELAVIMASHNGEAFHIDAVRSILEKANLTPEDLRCAFHPPMHKDSAETHLLTSAPKSPLYNNCSGKHAGMLAMAKFNDWPLETYLNPGHPLQLRIRSVVALFSGLDDKDIGVGVDGCSAPVFYMPLVNMAAMYARLAEGEMPPGRRVFDVMAGNAEMVAGTDRFDTEFMTAMAGGAISKIGAEGIRCVGLRGKPSLGIALKIEDGSKRASEAVMLATLAQLEMISEQQLRALEKYLRPCIGNHAGIETGYVEAVFSLDRRSGIS